ncbi:MAG TPA: carbohydrate ABC transporter permease [Patescibacteria group bacterium]|nr:carbohydrate ABC transporter permease [Patescibacteria group bacterium]
MVTTKSDRLARWVAWVALVVVVLGPIYWIVASSFKNPSEIIRRVPTLWPNEFYLGNYAHLLSSTPFPTYMVNSLVVAILSTVVTVSVATLAGFAMYRLRVRGAELLGRVVLLSYMIPTTLILVPLYVILASVGLVDTFAGLVVVNVAFALPFCVWLLRGFFDAIPIELDEAAAADGAGPLMTLWRVDLPLLAPGLATIGLYTFVFSYKEFVLASLLIVSSDLRTLPIGLGGIMGQYDIQWGWLMAATTLTMLPPALLFAAVGRYFVGGLTAGAVKGA